MEASFARSILVDAPMAVVAIDAGGHIRSSNATADAFFGEAMTCDPPLRIADFVEDLDLPVPTSIEALATFNDRRRNAAEGLYLRATAAGGAEAFVDVQAASFVDSGQKFLTLFITDMTAVVAAQAVAQDLRLQIAYNWRLNSLGEIASMLAHELNQPLSAVVNFLDAAKTLAGRDRPDQAKIVRFIESAEQQAERAGEVIRRMRSLLSKDTGFHAPEVMAEVMADIMPLLIISARECDAEVAVDVPGDEVARCDRVQIQQLLLNLVRNALDAPPNGLRRRILITGTAIDKGYRMTVEDNGPGVVAEIRDRLFTPLASTKPQGMGLGLSICRTIVEAHGGTIESVETPLGGAAFAFTLMDPEQNV